MIRVLCVILLLFSTFQLFSQKPIDKNKKVVVYVYEIKEEIAKPAWYNTKKAIREANQKNADLILLHLNTYGGLVDMADSIRTAILNSKIPFWVFIDNNAASAGALISIACDSIYMRKGGSIGAVTVVNQNAEQMPDKYQSYMRSMMRATAEAKGRDPKIAEAMVDPDVYIPNITDSGKVLTFTTSEAIKHNFCEGQVESIDEIFQLAGISDYEIIEQELSVVDSIIRFLTTPIISGLLIMIIIGGIYFELQTPGVGFPSIAAITAAILYFAPYYLEGLASNFDIILFVVGLILLAIEIFAIPGFGVTGILGIIFIIAGLSLGMIDNFQFRAPNPDLKPFIRSLSLVIISSFLGLVTSIYIAQKALKTSFLGHLALNTEERKEEGYIASEQRLNNLINREGIAATVMRPSGKIIIDGEYYDAIAEVGFIEKNQKVKVVRHENMQLIVKSIE